jgi:Icc-related predicted phosphoesterase
MRVLHISDWHARPTQAAATIRFSRLHEEAPADLVLITGDMLANFTDVRIARELRVERRRQRADWLEMAQLFRGVWPKAELVAVPGNHDFCNYAIKGLVRSFDRYEPKTMRVRGLRITGFRGVELFTGYWDGEFSDRYLDEMVKGLDPKADIVMTHLAPAGILDLVHETRAIGHHNLAAWAATSGPTLHCFGHVHECGGMTRLDNETTFSNAACSYNWLELPE